MLSETLYELLDQFAETPRSIVIKSDVINHGLKLNKDIVDLKGYFRNFFALNDGTTLFAVYYRESPYEIKKNNDRYFLLYQNDIITEVNFTKIPEYLKASKKKNSYIQYLMRSEKCAYIYPISACAYFFRNEECRYCGFNNAWDNYGKEKSNIIQNPEECVPLINAAISETGLEHVKLTGGSFYNLKKEADIYIDFAKTLRERTNIKEIYAYPQAFDKKDTKRLLDAGVDEVCYDIEVWDEDLWPKILPGKSRNIGRTEWLKRLVDAVDIFGEGKVATSIVAGYELAHPDGFKTIDEALKSNISGFEWLIKNGIEPLFFPWSPEMPGAKNSHGRNIVDLRTNEIPTSYYLQLGYELHKLMVKHEMYKKLGYENLGEEPSRNRLVCYKCGYHSISQDYPRLINK